MVKNTRMDYIPIVDIRNFGDTNKVKKRARGGLKRTHLLARLLLLSVLLGAGGVGAYYYFEHGGSASISDEAKAIMWSGNEQQQPVEYHSKTIELASNNPHSILLAEDVKSLATDRFSSRKLEQSKQYLGKQYLGKQYLAKQRYTF